jgi:hypothetical protein
LVEATGPERAFDFTARLGDQAELAADSIQLVSHCHQQFRPTALDVCHLAQVQDQPVAPPPERLERRTQIRSGTRVDRAHCMEKHKSSRLHDMDPQKPGFSLTHRVVLV